jgi:anti-sigma factor RsiW
MSTRRIECIEQESALVLYASGELDAAGAAALDAHCAQCVDCRSEREAQERIQGILRAGLYSGGARPGLWAGIEARLQREGVLAASTLAPLASVPARPRMTWRPFAGAAAAAALFGLGLWLGSRADVQSSQPAPLPLVVAPAETVQPDQPNRASPAPLERGLRRVTAAEQPLAATAQPLQAADGAPLEWIPAPRGASTASQQRLLH